MADPVSSETPRGSEALAEIGVKVSLAHFGSTDDAEKIINGITCHYAKLNAELTKALSEGGDPQPLKSQVAKATEAEVISIEPFVENASLMATLWQAGANFIQGYYLSPPLPEMSYEFSEIA